MVMSPQPWTAGGVVLKASVLKAVEDEALAGYARDEEACGYLKGPAAEPLLCDEHVRMDNIANKLHAIDPERYFRTARTFFDFNGKRFSDAVENGASAGRPVKVLYHSHLDAGAYFSPTDAAMMSGGEPPAEEGGQIVLGPGPAFPLAFLVTSVRGGSGEGRPEEAPRIAEHRLFVWDGAAFVASTFSVVD
ncbi:Mov34/MPN/PAD-1 family protein [Sorangium sp. So ce302]|uniref:Mov34/MPN/PAD-1 family protein n=1 Tax=Sorangium sp. So ce302 TaxID=3133297 RepID=UPI003F5FE6D4